MGLTSDDGPDQWKQRPYSKNQLSLRQVPCSKCRSSYKTIHLKTVSARMYSLNFSVCPFLSKVESFSGTFPPTRNPES